MADKERLDVILVNRGLAASREAAKAHIMAGEVFAGGVREDKPGTKIDINADIELRGDKLKYVSRGGLKLEKAVAEFGLSLQGKVCIDIGASTGGFTDCMLQNGASFVFAIDVGYGQFAWKLRTDERVRCMEKTNIRYVKPEDLGREADFASVDVSFISLTKVLPAASGLLKDGGEIVCLIKPQFEAGREKVGKKGVVRDIGTHKEVIVKIINYAAENGWGIIDISFSPIKGPEGNIEYLIYMKKAERGVELGEAMNMADRVTAASHEIL